MDVKLGNSTIPEETYPKSEEQESDHHSEILIEAEGVSVSNALESTSEKLEEPPRCLQNIDPPSTVVPPVATPLQIMHARDVYRSVGIDGDEFPPNYSDTGNDLETMIQNFKSLASAGEFSLPITGDSDTESGRDILSAFFEAIASKKDEIVALFIESDLVTANTKNSHGVTPLLAAVGVGNIRMVQELLDFGAEVDEWGVPPHIQYFSVKYCSCTLHRKVERTPLQLAAAVGNLTLVKLFIEVYNANDALIAKDGQLALRLAAENGHREIANYLPIRRGGAWRRWKTQHSTAMRRIKKAGRGIYKFFEVLLYHIPKFFLWNIPKALFWTAPKDFGEWAWKNRHKFATLFQKIPESCVNFAKEIPHAVAEIGLWLLKIPKGIPKATVVVVKFIWMVLKTIGRAIAHVGKSTFSLLHSLFKAVISFFRTVTLEDLRNGLIEVFKLPLRLWDLLEAFAEGTFEAMEALFGFTGVVVTWIGYGLLFVITYVPRKLWEILASMGGLIGKAFSELLVLINPRR